MKKKENTKNIKDVTPGTALWLCKLCGNLTGLQVNKYWCICECKERHGEEPELQIYLGHSIVMIITGYDPVETTVYKFYSTCEDTVWSSPIEGFDEIYVY